MNRLRIIGIILGCLIVGLIVFVSVFKSGPGEPSYQGRTLSRWLQDYDDASTPGTTAILNGYEVSKASEAAVVAIGTNAIPTLLEWLKAEDRPVRVLVGSLLLPRSYRDAHDKHCMARWSFNFLGDRARSAAPALAELTKHKNIEIRECALSCLVKIHADREIFLPVLNRLIHDPNPIIRDQATSIKAMYLRIEAEKNGIPIAPSGINSGTNNIQVR